jgi:2,4-dienoyl-CoA reductase-like NADH-dependent reductase (Old Yellow Enzyme family)
MSKVPDPFEPARLGPVTLRNRIIKAATYENMARRGLVTSQLIEFHVRHAAGGVGMTTVAYCAVSRERRMAADPATRSACTHCNKCMTTIFGDGGTRCALVPEG